MVESKLLLWAPFTVKKGGQLDGTALGHCNKRRCLQLVMFFSTKHRGRLDETLSVRHRCWMYILECECLEWELVLSAHLDTHSSVLKRFVGLVPLTDHIASAENVSTSFVGHRLEEKLLCHHLRSSVWVCFQPACQESNCNTCSATRPWFAPCISKSVCQGANQLP